MRVVDPLVAPPERCLLCGGRHNGQLRADGQRVLTVAQAALHINCSEEEVYKQIRDGGIIEAPNRGPRQKAILERNVLNYLEGRPQERPPVDPDDTVADRAEQNGDS